MRWHYSILSFFNWSQISSRHTVFLVFWLMFRFPYFARFVVIFFFCIRFIFFLRSIFYVHSCLMVWGASARPFTLSRSAVLRNAGSWSWATLTSPAYINSKMAVRCWNGTSFRMMIGCLAGFSSKRACKKNKLISSIWVCHALWLWLCHYKHFMLWYHLTYASP